MSRRWSDSVIWLKAWARSSSSPLTFGKAGRCTQIACGDFFGRFQEGIDLAKDESLGAKPRRKKRQQRYDAQKDQDHAACAGLL